jgi:hypothetical protein
MKGIFFNVLSLVAFFFNVLSSVAYSAITQGLVCLDEPVASVRPPRALPGANLFHATLHESDRRPGFGERKTCPARSSLNPANC